MRNAATIVVCLLLLLALGVTASAATFTVTTNANGGAGSLRQAITDANAAAGPDVIEFAAGMSGKTVRPTTALPALTDPGTEIRGDINSDGAPDIVLNGSSAPAGTKGLTITGSDCTVKGLAIYSFPSHGIFAQLAPRTTIVSCHGGVNLAGTSAVSNGEPAIYLDRSDDCRIGGTTAAERNVLYRGSSVIIAVGLSDSNGCEIWGNYIGINRAGTAALGSLGTGIHLNGWSGTCSLNEIGGTAAGQGNVIAGLTTGVSIFGHSDGNVLAGNLFGLGADGSTAIPLGGAGVSLITGVTNTVVGGTASGARNVFGAAVTGVEMYDLGTDGNQVLGNYFGSNAAGTAQRALGTGVRVTSGAGAQTIGASGRGRNYFTPQSAGSTVGVWLDNSGSGTDIARNTFGARPDGVNADIMDYAIRIVGATARVDGNTIARADTGLTADGAGNVGAFGNTFRNNGVAVRAQSTVICRLGNLGNGDLTDDGGNFFRSSNTLFIVNETAASIKAEGNDFASTVSATIDAKITDRLDDPSLGRVDFNPLLGGVIPTGDTDRALALTGAAAVPVSGGAEIAFSLSAPANVTVEVLNLAGRLVAAPAQDRPTSAGLQRVLWTGLSQQGTAAPAGRYLVRISAAAPSGELRSAAAPLTLSPRR